MALPFHLPMAQTLIGAATSLLPGTAPCDGMTQPTILLSLKSARPLLSSHSSCHFKRSSSACLKLNMCSKCSSLQLLWITCQQQNENADGTMNGTRTPLARSSLNPCQWCTGAIHYPALGLKINEAFQPRLTTGPKNRGKHDRSIITEKDRTPLTI
jgi:hypothetical protein